MRARSIPRAAARARFRPGYRARDPAATVSSSRGQASGGNTTTPVTRQVAPYCTGTSRCFFPNPIRQRVSGSSLRKRAATAQPSCLPACIPLQRCGDEAPTPSVSRALEQAAGIRDPLARARGGLRPNRRPIGAARHPGNRVEAAAPPSARHHRRPEQGRPRNGRWAGPATPGSRRSAAAPGGNI